MRTPRPAAGISRTLRARSVLGSVSESVPENGGVRGNVPRGVSGLFGPRAPEYPKSVPRVCPECLEHLFDTLGTLFGHSGARGPKVPETPRGTFPRTPPFSGTLSETLPRTLRARKARETPVAGRGVRNLVHFS